MSRHDLSDDNDGLVPGFPPGGGWSGPAGPVPQPRSGLDPRAVPMADAPAVPGVPAPAATARHAQRPQRRRRPRRLAGGVALTLLVAAGLAGVGGGGVGLALELPRTATKAEVAAAVQAEIASRWQRLAAGKIFPEAVGYSTSDESAPMTARLVGIASPASCAAALDPPAASLLRRYGCATVLRATYVDASGTLATTAGIVVMTSASAASHAVSASGGAPASTGAPLQRGEGQGGGVAGRGGRGRHGGRAGQGGGRSGGGVEGKGGAGAGLRHPAIPPAGKRHGHRVGDRRQRPDRDQSDRPD